MHRSTKSLAALGFVLALSGAALLPSAHAEHDSSPNDVSNYVPPMPSHPSAPADTQVPADVERNTAVLNEAQEEADRIQEQKDIADMYRMKEEIDKRLREINDPDAPVTDTPLIGEASLAPQASPNAYLPVSAPAPLKN